MGLALNALTTLGPVLGELGAVIPGLATTWAPNTSYGTGAFVQPKTAPNGRIYKSTTAFQSGATEPVWPLVAGASVADANGFWTDQGPSVQPRLERYINAASDAIEKYCNRKFLYGRYTENLGGSGKFRLVVARTPLRNIVSVSYNGAALDATEYEIENGAPSGTGFIYRQSGFVNTAPFMLSANPFQLPGWEYDVYQVVYDGGWQTPQFDGLAGQGGTAGAAAAIPRDLPYDLEEACVALVASYWRRAGMDRNNQAESFGDAKIEFVQASAQLAADVIPADVRAVLERYRRRL